MYCKHCGFKLEDGSNFCSKCGTKIESAPVVNNTSVTVNNNSSAVGDVACALVAVPLLGILSVDKLING